MYLNEFKIAKNDSFDPATMELRRYDGVNKSWSSIEVELFYQDKDSYHFESKVPGFSIFAIVGEKIDIIEEEEVIDGDILQGNVVKDIEEPNKENLSPRPNWLIPLIIVSVLILIVVAYYLWKRKLLSRRFY